MEDRQPKFLVSGGGQILRLSQLLTLGPDRVRAHFSRMGWARVVRAWAVGPAHLAHLQPDLLRKHWAHGRPKWTDRAFLPEPTQDREWIRGSSLGRGPVRSKPPHLHPYCDGHRHSRRSRWGGHRWLSTTSEFGGIPPLTVGRQRGHFLARGGRNSWGKGVTRVRRPSSDGDHPRPPPSFSFLLTLPSAAALLYSSITVVASSSSVGCCSTPLLHLPDK